jgi:hypothetical protein
MRVLWNVDLTRLVVARFMLLNLKFGNRFFSPGAGLEANVRWLVVSGFAVPTTTRPFTTHFFVVSESGQIQGFEPITETNIQKQKSVTYEAQLA